MKDRGFLNMDESHASMTKTNAAFESAVEMAYVLARGWGQAYTVRAGAAIARLAVAFTTIRSIVLAGTDSSKRTSP